MLCCNGVVLNAQSIEEFFDAPNYSYIGGEPVYESFANEMEGSYYDDSVFFTQASSTICYDDYGDPITLMGGGTCEENGLHSSDPGLTVPIGDTCYFWIIASVLYGLRCFFKRKKTSNKVS